MTNLVDREIFTFISNIPEEFGIHRQYLENNFIFDTISEWLKCLISIVTNLYDKKRLAIIQKLFDLLLHTLKTFPINLEAW